MGNMNILAIDASTAVLSLSLEAGDNFYQYNTDRGFQHSELIMPGVDYLFNDAQLNPTDLDLICTTLGPGSFTGLRVGMSTAKGISAGSSTPLVAVPTLDILAAPFSFFNGTVVPLIDARKSCFYSALYLQGKRETDFLDIEPSLLIKKIEEKSDTREILFTGPDCKLIEEQAQSLSVKGWKIYFDQYCRRGNGKALITLGRQLFEERGADPMDLGPLYLRKSEAELSLERKE
jgi:tRNA threonylcarbamoyladenosine biosynthesis protein TsaB